MDSPRSCRRAAGALALILMLPAVGRAGGLDLDRVTPVPAGEQIPIQDFFRPPILRSPTLNRSGTHIAAVIANGEEHTSLMVYNLKTKKIETLSLRGDSDVNSVTWLNEDLLLFGVGIRKQGTIAQCAARIGNLSTCYPLLQAVASGLIAVPPGDRMHPLASIQDHTMLTGRYSVAVRLIADLETGSLIDFNGNGVPSGAELDKAMEANTRHIAHRYPELETPEGFTLYFMADKEGRLAYAVSSTNGVLTLNRLADDTWRPCPEDLDAINLIGPGEKPGQIVVLGPRRDGKTRLLEFMNAGTGKAGEVILEDPAYDFDGWIYRDPVSHDIAGVMYDGVVPKTVWFSQAYREVQQAVERLFPGTNRVVRILGNDEEGKGIFLVGTFSDRQPVTYYWVDLKAHTAGPIQNSQPWLDPKRMQPMGVIRYRTRDGRTLDAYVTLPPGASKQHPAPMVVLPPFGLGARYNWGFSDEAQFFASRGYAVLQPNLRGSPGYTWMFPESDEWAFRKMADDVTDATRAMLASGLVDRHRVAIVGEVDGGYLALSGVAYEPDLYRAAVAISPVCDWAKAIKENKYYQYSDPWFARIVRKLGDPAKDPKKFDDLAPLRHADQIRAAVLIVTGEYDPTYESIEAKDMVSTLRSKHIAADTMHFLDEGYGIRHLAHQIELYTRIESFLAENLGPAAPAGAN